MSIAARDCEHVPLVGAPRSVPWSRSWYNITSDEVRREADRRHMERAVPKTASRNFLL